MTKEVLVSTIIVSLILSCSVGGCRKREMEGGNSRNIPIIEPEPPPKTIHERPCWSPDGETIAYVYIAQEYEELARGAYQLWLFSFQTGEESYLTEGELPDISPDGNWIAFVRHRDIFIMKVNGDSLRQLTFGYQKGNFFPNWSPDGKSLIYDSAEGEEGLIYSVWIMNLETGEKWDLDILGRDPCWSPDGEWFAYKGLTPYGESKLLEDIYIARKDGSDTKQLTSSPFDGNPDHNTANRGIAWSPDGSKIAFNSYIHPYMDIWLLDAEGRPPQRLTADGSEHPAWSPDGRRIAYARYDGNAGIWMMNADGTGKRQLTFP